MFEVKFNLIDYIYGPLAFVIIVLVSRVIKYREIEKHPEYKYFTKGLYAKLLGGISFLLVYVLYYGGGDTVHYILDSNCLVNLLFQNPSAFFTIMRRGAEDPSWYFFFNDETGYPVYYRDPQTFFVVRMAVPLVFLAAGSSVVSTILFAALSYAGIWKLYKVFLAEFPDLHKQLAIAILFIPSVVFWGSGVMKDTITLCFVGYYCYSFYYLILKNKFSISNLFILILSVYFILKIKPYIVFALLPGSLLWYVNVKVASITNTMIKFLSGPFMLMIGLAGGYLLLANMGSVLGQYSIENVMDKAVVTNQDLKADYYGGSSFDIGDFDATIPSMLSMAPAAIIAGIFRPFIWESKNIVMIFSGLEGLVLLFVSIRTLFRVRGIHVIPLIFKNHMVTFSIIFSVFFAFSVGISTSNFGSLVRYRIPVLPFFLASMFIIEYLYKKKKENK